jgi:PadR family transcriptional regulator PadR
MVKSSNQKEAWLSQVKRGVLELCILNLLAQEGSHGYELVKRLGAVPGLVVTEGTIYPLLSRLKKEGSIQASFVESSHGPIRKIYTLSASGDRQRRVMNEAWQEVVQEVSNIIKQSGE